VHLLELNAEPAIELTGPRLTWILEDLFAAIARVCVQPFVHRASAGEAEITEEEVTSDGDMWLGGERYGLRKCLDLEVRGAGAW
jgi:tubulin--tyrosine ligase